MNLHDDVTRNNRIAGFRQRVLSERGLLRAALGQARAQQAAVLADLLEFNSQTEFGRSHGFSRIRTISDFRKAVPVMDYAALSPWVERMAAGASRVLTADDPVVYFTSSGSTGAHKKIPVTPRFMHTTFFPFFYAAWAPFTEHFPGVLTARDAVLNLKHDPAPAPGRTSSGHPHLGASQVDFGTAFGEPFSAEPGSDASWSVLPAHVEPGDHLAKDYARLRRAVEADIQCVIGINPAMVAALPYQLRLWWPRIVKDVRDGTLDGRPLMSPNPGRARELERLQARLPVVRPAHLWPNMRVILCWPTGLASLYLPRLREEYGIGVSVLPAPVAASEGPVSVTLDRHRRAGNLVVSAAVYEFAPAEADAGDPGMPTLRPEELEAGRDYHVIFSHVGGLYRYALGDIVRVTDTDGGLPRVEYAGRASVCDAAGERLREAQVIRAIAAALDRSGLEARNATCRVQSPGTGPARYEFALSPQFPVSAEEGRSLITRLDEALGAEAPGYRRARRAGSLAPPALLLLDPEAFTRDWHAQVASGTRPAQVKDRVFRSDPGSWRRLTGQSPSARPACPGDGQCPAVIECPAEVSP